MVYTRLSDVNYGYSAADFDTNSVVPELTELHPCGQFFIPFLLLICIYAFSVLFATKWSKACDKEFDLGGMSPLSTTFSLLMTVSCF